MKHELAANLARLRAAGRLLSPAARPSVAPNVTFPVFPLRARPEWEGQYQGFFQLVNYVDLDPAAGQVLDYQCGGRTYDGREGIDYTLSPFPGG